MLKKYVFLILVLVSCFCLFGFTDSDNVSPSEENIVDLTDTRWTFDSFYNGGMFDNDWTAWGMFNVLVDYDDGRSLVPDSSGYSLKVGYNLDTPDSRYVSYHFSDVGWVAYKLLSFTYICDIVGGSDVTNPRLIEYFESFCAPYDYFYGLYIMHYNDVSTFNRDVSGVVKVSDNVNLSNLKTLNLNVVYDEFDSSLSSVSFGSYSFVHDVYINGRLTDYSSEYTLIVIDEDCNYNYNLLSFLFHNSDQILPVYDSVFRPTTCDLNGSLPLPGTFTMDLGNVSNFISSSGSRSGTVRTLIECDGRYYIGFDIHYNSILDYYDIKLLSPAFGTYSDLSLGHFYTNGDYISPELISFTFSSSSLSGVNLDFYNWFVSSTDVVSLAPVDGAVTLSGVWQANSTLVYLDFNESIKFLVNGVWYNRIFAEPGYGPPEHYVLYFRSEDFNGNFEYEIRAAFWTPEPIDGGGPLFEFGEWRSGIIDFGKYDQFVSSDFYNWFVANFTYVGESEEVPPSDEELLGFFPRLFSSIQQAMDSLIFYTTGTGYNLTLWTFIIVILGIAFVVWILKLIAGG